MNRNLEIGSTNKKKSGGMLATKFGYNMCIKNGNSSQDVSKSHKQLQEWDQGA